MVRTLVLMVGVLFVIPQHVQAQAPQKVQITGTVGGSNLLVIATNSGSTFTGDGKLTAPTGQGYYLKVQSGSVIQNRYVSLQGVILAPNGTPFTTFVLNGDRTTGGILFMYTGNRGTLIKQSTVGSVVIQ